MAAKQEATEENQTEYICVSIVLWECSLYSHI